MHFHPDIGPSSAAGFATTRTGRSTCAAARVRSTESTVVVVVVVINGSGAAAVAVRVGARASRVSGSPLTPLGLVILTH